MKAEVYDKNDALEVRGIRNVGCSREYEGRSTGSISKDDWSCCWRWAKSGLRKERNLGRDSLERLSERLSQGNIFLYSTGSAYKKQIDQMMLDGWVDYILRLQTSFNRWCKPRYWRRGCKTRKWQETILQLAFKMADPYVGENSWSCWGFIEHSRLVSYVYNATKGKRRENG